MSWRRAVICACSARCSNNTWEGIRLRKTAIILAAVLAFSAVLWYVFSNTSTSQGFQTITADQLKEKISANKSFVLVDLREPELYQAGHVAGAINIPFDQFQKRMGELSFESDIVFICHDGMMGEVVGKMLVEKGYRKVANVYGGMFRWNGPVTSK